MVQGSQGYLGELYIQTGSLLYSNFTKVGTITDFALGIVSNVKEITTHGSILKNKNFKNFESSFKNWSFTFNRIYIDTSLDEDLLSSIFEDSNKIWVKIIPKKRFSYGSYRRIFLGYGLITQRDIINAIIGAVKNSNKIIGIGPIFPLKENESGIIFFDSTCVESALANGFDLSIAEYSDLYTSLPCSGGWSEPVYISTGNIVASADWTETSCVGSYRKFAGYFGIQYGLPPPPTGQTTTPPTLPTIAIPPACLASTVLGKRWGNEVGDEVLLFGVQGPVYDAKPLHTAITAGFQWTPILPFHPSVIQLSWGSFATCSATWTSPGYANPPFGLGGGGATIPSYNQYVVLFGSLEPISEGKANNKANTAGNTESDGVYIRAIPPNSAEGNCVVDSGACDFTYDIVMMLVNGAFNHSLDVSVEFYADSLGAQSLGLFSMPNYSIHSGVTWTNINIIGTVPIGSRFYSINVKWNNPNLITYIYGYLLERTGMRFQY